VKKVSNKCGILFVIFKILPKVSHRQMGENSPILVTLFPTDFLLSLNAWSETLDTVRQPLPFLTLARMYLLKDQGDQQSDQIGRIFAQSLIVNFG
jgi:hypothetical protein